jgi:hypothetical protein
MNPSSILEENIKLRSDFFYVQIYVQAREVSNFGGGGRQWRGGFLLKLRNAVCVGAPPAVLMWSRVRYSIRDLVT